VAVPTEFGRGPGWSPAQAQYILSKEDHCGGRLSGLRDQLRPVRSCRCGCRRREQGAGHGRRPQGARAEPRAQRGRPGPDGGPVPRVVLLPRGHGWAGHALPVQATAARDSHDLAASAGLRKPLGPGPPLLRLRHARPLPGAGVSCAASATRTRTGRRGPSAVRGARGGAGGEEEGAGVRPSPRGRRRLCARRPAPRRDEAALPLGRRGRAAQRRGGIAAAALRAAGAAAARAAGAGAAPRQGSVPAAAAATEPAAAAAAAPAAPPAPAAAGAPLGAGAVPRPGAPRWTSAASCTSRPSTDGRQPALPPHHEGARAQCARGGALHPPPHPPAPPIIDPQEFGADITCGEMAVASNVVAGEA